ncbi:MFS transporter [Pararhodobacter zhoushanensis]|uniref:MFS transporter n=1 Tax=Pararhodobacter zhoushanensis TaxID=2479545 RepID=A0ABT3H4I4_9RHOB|nr:MFS transporter [Pararhodobacter zhoushanensis]MCW1934718.1 MFS transporter [Pararhodobacter zhoushanensis]
MFERSIPEWLRHPPSAAAYKPGARAFATLSGVEAMIRGSLLSVFPLAMYAALGDAATVSTVYFAVGLTSLCVGLLLPWVNRLIPRRWLYTVGASLYVVGGICGALGGMMVIAALVCCTLATVTCFICLNAYVLDYVAKNDLGKTETLRMFYSALAWSAGPVSGVALMKLWPPAPFLLAAVFALVQIAVFWWLRLGNGKLIQRARGAAPNPVAFLSRFFAQPRLIAGWLFAVLRSCGWWGYIVYLPLYAIESGLNPELGGILVSVTNAFLFITPLMLRWVQRHSVRTAVRTGFFCAAVGFLLAALSPVPALAVACLFAASAFLVLLDVSGGLPFLMAVKPSERTEMAAVYSSFRDVSGVMTPGLGAVILLFAPIQGIFAAVGLGLGAMYLVAGRLHPALGVAPSARVRRAV